MNRLYLYLRGVAGLLQDLYRIARMSFSNPHSYTKFLTINRMRQTTGAKTFIEAGTYRGVTTARCARVFERVYTIELDKDLADQATHRLSSYQNVEVIQGDALEIIPMLMKKQELSDVLLFLDGHFSGGDTAHGDLFEPAAEELKVLKPYREKILAVVIDDLRSFGTEQHVPKKSELLRSAEEAFTSDFNINVFLDQLIITRKNPSQMAVN